MDNLICISKTADGDFSFSFASEDGRKIAYSDAYATLSACKNCIAAFIGCKDSQQCESNDIAWFEGKPVYEVFAENGKHSFLLKGKYGEILVFGEMFDTAEERDAAIEYARACTLRDPEEYEVVV